MRKSDNFPQTRTSSNSKRSRSHTRLNSSIESTPSPQPQTVKKSKTHSVKSPELSDKNAKMGDDDLKAYILKVVTDSETKVLSRLHNLETITVPLSDNLKQLTTKVDKLQNADRRKNVVINGLVEKNGKKWSDRDNHITELAKKLGLPHIDYDHCFRMRIFSEEATRPRPLLLKLVRQRDALQLLSLRTKLHSSNIFIDEDMTTEEIETKFHLRKFARDMKKDKPDLLFRITKKSLKITVGGTTKWYTVNEANQVVENDDTMT